LTLLAGFVRVGVEGHAALLIDPVLATRLASSLRIGAVLQAIGFKPE
jgi:hypothetical protein